MSDKSNTMISLNNVQFSWPKQSEPVLAIESFYVERGERVFLRGPSGSGKTTLLSLITAILSPQRGTVAVDSIELRSLRGGQRDQFRVDHIGLVFQQFNLLPFLSIHDNVLLPCRFSKRRASRAMENGHDLESEADRLLNAMQLPPAEIKDRPVSELSVGQQQRVAVARALIGKPPLIIADEPTSALDSDTREAFIKLLFSEASSANCTLLFVSHDASLATHFDRSVDLADINRVTVNSVKKDITP